VLLHACLASDYSFYMTGDWRVLAQDRIDRFAEATGDHQWIHVVPLKAASAIEGGRRGQGRRSGDHSRQRQR